MDFIVPLAEPRVKPQQSTALHLMVAIVLCAVGFASGVLYWFTGVSPKLPEYTPFAVFGSACFVAGLVIGALAIAARRNQRAGGKWRGLRIAELVLLAAGAVVFVLQDWNFPALLFSILAAAVLLAVVGERGDNTNKIRLDDGGIYRPFSLRRRRIPWHDVQRVLLRYGTLTIDLTSNALLQYRVGAHDVDAEIFEAWAVAMVEKGRAERPKNDW